MSSGSIHRVLLCAFLALGCAGCLFKSDEPLTDKPLEAHQIELLDLAISAASAIPVDPHIKDRSAAQAKVIEICLKLNQPARAVKYSEAIGDWQRGASLAEVALYCAQNDLADQAETLIEQAEEVLNTAEDWRKDVIKVKIAQTHATLGNTKKAGEFETNVIEAEQGKVAKVNASRSDDKDFGAQVENLNNLIAGGHFDVVRNALNAYAVLYDSHYQDAQHRSLIEEKIRSSWEPQPIFHRIEWLNALARAALKHGDKAKGLELINEAQAMVESHEWPPEHRISVLASIIPLRHQAGDTEKAAADAKGALEFFEQNKKLIFDIWRAGALRPLAEAHMKMGSSEAAHATYKLALEEGAVNPNARPRAEDLAATCSSMALVGFKPDDELWDRIRTIRNKLGEPW